MKSCKDALAALRIFTLVILGFGLVACDQGEDSNTNGGDNGETPQDPVGKPSVGIPDQDSLSLSFSRRNPEAWKINGAPVEVTAQLADHLNNSNTIPNGTKIYFTAEGGAIDAFCTTVDGACSVTWRSQDPRPIKGDDKGKVTILAYTLGNESFTDSNNNGYFDDGDLFQSVSGLHQDVSEPYRDDNQNFAYDEGEEEFFECRSDEFSECAGHPNANGQFDRADGKYAGVSCAHSSKCADTQHKLIFKNEFMCMSDSTANFTMFTETRSLNRGDIVDLPVTLTIIIQDSNGLSMPGETMIRVETNNGVASNTANQKVKDNVCSSAHFFNLTINKDNESSVGTFQVFTSTPKGIETASFPIFLRD